MKSCGSLSGHLAHKQETEQLTDLHVQEDGAFLHYSFLQLCDEIVGWTIESPQRVTEAKSVQTVITLLQNICG